MVLEMWIKLNTINDVKDFVEICSKCNCEVDIKQGRHIVDGKSILGIFSLNLLEPVKVVIDSDYGNDKIVFYNDIEKWKVNGNGNTVCS